jgi:hypothetical protein
VERDKYSKYIRVITLRQFEYFDLGEVYRELLF